MTQACREGELALKLRDEQFCLLQCAVVEAEGIILDAVAKLDDPIHVRCISSPGSKNKRKSRDKTKTHLLIGLRVHRYCTITKSNTLIVKTCLVAVDAG